MLKNSIGMLCLSLTLTACMSSNVQQLGYIDISDKSVTVPIGSGLLIGELKKSLREQGWKLSVDHGPRVTQGTVGETTRLESFSTLKTRYRLYARAHQDRKSTRLNSSH